MKQANASPMLNAYPDSIGGKLGDIVEFLQRPEMGWSVWLFLHSAQPV